LLHILFKTAVSISNSIERPYTYRFHFITNGHNERVVKYMGNQYQEDLKCLLLHLREPHNRSLRSTNIEFIPRKHFDL
jgi:hypothetical protein